MYISYYIRFCILPLPLMIIGSSDFTMFVPTLNVALIKDLSYLVILYLTIVLLDHIKDYYHKDFSW